MNKILIGAILLISAMSGAEAKREILLSIEGEAQGTSWTSLTTYSANTRPVIEEYRNCLRRECTGDWYDGNYQCGDCLEYSEVIEKIKWKTEVQTSFYYKNELKTTKTDIHFFPTHPNAKGGYSIIMEWGNLYSQACPTRDNCFRNFVLLNQNGMPHTIGEIDSMMSPKFTILGKIISGEMRVTQDNQNLNLPATYKVNKKTWKATGTLVIKNEFVNEFKKALSKIIEPTRQEAGCIQYEVSQSLESPNRFEFYELWVSKEAMMIEHMQNASHMKVFLKETEALIESMEFDSKYVTMMSKTLQDS